MRATFIQILDSRGNPTIQARYDGLGIPLRIAVPSGASTGVHEAVELRDGLKPYDGKGVLQALHNATLLSNAVSWDPASVVDADRIMRDMDATPNKSKMGANAILAVSMLQSVVEARQQQVPLHEFLAKLAGTTPALPLPFANIINGGRHASNALMFQEFMIVPIHAKSFYEATMQVSETTHALKKLIKDEYGGSQTGVGDEGGFAPDIDSPSDACKLLMEAMQIAGYELGIAIDAAASEFFDAGSYETIKGESHTASELVEYYVELIRAYPIISLEDPFAEDDFASFALLRTRLAEEGLSCQIVGDDLTVTNVKRIGLAIDAGSCDCLLLKINQIGSITESIDAATMAMRAGWNVMVSHRSGETSDTFIADLSVALGCGQIKLGAPVRGERTAKYNRLLELEYEFGLSFPSNKPI